MLKTDPLQIDLWLAFPDDVHDARQLDEYCRLLTEEELCRARRYYFAKDRHCYLVTRALVRTVLSRYAEIGPAAWRFCANAYGKPSIANNHSAARQIAFNISHTAGLVVLAVTGVDAIGVDTENMRMRQVPFDVARQFFSSSECAALHALPNGEQRERFFALWTLKEAYIKARGKGLSIALDHFSFDFPGNNGIAIAIAPQLEDSPSNWQFWQFRLGENHMVSICSGRSTSAIRRMTLKKVVPLVSEEMVDCTMLRCSVDDV
jgi:4'-phosphopantetheinyl transferase